jgi:hypothetical protein
MLLFHYSAWLKVITPWIALDELRHAADPMTEVIYELQ